MRENFVIYADGSCDHDWKVGGAAAIVYALENPPPERKASLKWHRRVWLEEFPCARFICPMSFCKNSNEAEMAAVRMAVKDIPSSCQTLTVFTDSLHVVRRAHQLPFNAAMRVRHLHDKGTDHPHTWCDHKAREEMQRQRKDMIGETAGRR